MKRTTSNGRTSSAAVDRRGMANDPASGPADQADVILARAAELFARYGYRGTSMNDVAGASGVSKATLYHYYQDKDEMLVSIAEGHVTRLVDLVDAVSDEGLRGERRLRAMIERFLREYSHAQHSHRVLTEDVRFLPETDRKRILRKERHVVRAFAEAVAEMHPELTSAALAKPVAMLLMGMLNWMFTWWKPGGLLDAEAMAPIVSDLFTGGLQSVASRARSDGHGTTGKPRTG
jgi:AcrR family transcriptional regulator